MLIAAVASQWPAKGSDQMRLSLEKHVGRWFSANKRCHIFQRSDEVSSMKRDGVREMWQRDSSSKDWQTVLLLIRLRLHQTNREQFASKEERIRCRQWAPFSLLKFSSAEVLQESELQVLFKLSNCQSAFRQTLRKNAGLARKMMNFKECVCHSKIEEYTGAASLDA